MAQDWIILSVVTLVMWGFWGFLVKVALKSLSWQQTLIFTEISFAIIILVLFLFYRPELPFNQGTLLALSAGVVAGVGAIVFYLALNSGKISVITPITALYPIVTIMLAFLILQEKITLIQGSGIGLAVLSIILLSL